MMIQEKDLTCSFCRKHGNEVKRLVAGPNGIFICNECIEVCSAILREDSSEEEKTQLIDLRPLPRSRNSSTSTSSARKPQRGCSPSPCTTITSAS